LEQLDENSNDAIRLLQNAIDAKDWQLCRELLRFLHSIDDTGGALRKALTETNIIDLSIGAVTTNEGRALIEHGSINLSDTSQLYAFHK
jgi:hypothetical protein